MLVSVGLRVPANEMVGLEYEVGMVIACKSLIYSSNFSFGRSVENRSP